MKKTLIVFEFADEIDVYLAGGPDHLLTGEGIAILAILPETQVRLKRMGVPYSNTFPFFGKRGHEEALLRSDTVYRFCAGLIRIEDELGIKEGYKNSLLLYTRVYVNYILWLIRILTDACAQLSIDEVVCFPHSSTHPADPMLHRTEGLAAEIGRRVAVLRGIPVRAYPVQAQTAEGRPQKVLALLGKASVFLFFHIRMAVELIAPRNRFFILAPEDAYNLRRVLDRFREKFAAGVCYLSSKEGYPARKLLPLWSSEERIVPLPKICPGRSGAAFRRVLSDVSDRIKRHEEAAAVLSYKGVDFQDLFIKKLDEDILPFLASVHGKSVHLDMFLKRRRPALVISQMSRDISYNLGELCALRGIPSLLISHGSHVPPRNEYEMIEWKEHGRGLMNTHYGHVALQSPWAQAYLAKVPTTSKQIVTGPLLFARIDRDQDKRARLRETMLPRHKNKIILLNADTSRQRLAMRFYIYQTLDEYLYTLNSLIKAVEQVPEFHLIIRYRPIRGLSTQDIVPLLVPSDCYSIRSEGSFEDYLTIADMLTCYASTTIEEALQNRVPVLQYDVHGKYRHIDGQTLSPTRKPEVDSCYYVGQENDLPWALSWLARNHFAGEPSASLWQRHLFPEAEKTDLPAYFRGLFRTAPRQGAEHGRTDALA